MSMKRKGKPQPWHSRPRTDEERRKISESVKRVALKGPLNPNWKGGVTEENALARQTFEYERWRFAVFERDGFVCQDCGYDKGSILEAHHIKPFSDYPELRYVVRNGVTLCHYCHQIRHTKSPTKIANIIRKRDALYAENED